MRPILYALLLFNCTSLFGQQAVEINIDTQIGHAIVPGSSGFNVRIADKVWSYTHPDFQAAVEDLRPGWLRFFSGTMGDAFSSATGQYDLDYAWMFDKQEQYTKGYAFTEVKGPHRIAELYEVLGGIGSKLVVTVNGFSETPDITAELVRFCINNHIEVEAWQFCNEPYFYVPGRNRYWWNDGYDYALKMKPHADSILQLLPDAQLALNFTWDGIWPFMKEIKRYQDEQGRYWNLFSKHSYAPHIGRPEPFPEGFQRLNTKIIEATDAKAMQEIEDYTWPGAKMMITEFGVWNRPLNGIISAIYNAEYTLRQLAHENTWLIGSHEISNKAIPSQNRNDEILQAYSNGQTIDTDTMRTGHQLTHEGKALKILHEVTNHSNFIWNTQITNMPQVQGMDNTKVEGLFALAFRGQSGNDFLVVTNRSGEQLPLNLKIDGQSLKKKMTQVYIQADDPQSKDFPIIRSATSGEKLFIPPHSVIVYSWANQGDIPLPASRIYQAKIKSQGIQLKWWPVESAESYEIRYGQQENQLDQSLIVDGSQTQMIVPNLEKDKSYNFQVFPRKGKQIGQASKTIQLDFKAPTAVSIFKTATRNQSITVWWRSVANANGYLVKATNLQTKAVQIYNAKNAFGYRFEEVDYDVPYHLEVLAYNGLDTSKAANFKTVRPRTNLPIPAMNISAAAQADGRILLKWVTQDSIHDDVRYRLLRGPAPHDFEPIAENITGSTYFDTLPDPEQDYFYTLKTYNQAGESNFYPNVASIIPYEQARRITVEKTEDKVDYFLIKVVYENIPQNQVQQFGLSYSNISYLNAEATPIAGQDLTSSGARGSYTVRLPKQLLRKNATFALKAYIKNDLETTFSIPPYPNIRTN